MCTSAPKYDVVQPTPTPEVQTVTMDAADSTAANLEGDRQRRLRALSRLQTMTGGAMQGTELGTGKVKLGA